MCIFRSVSTSGYYKCECPLDGDENSSLQQPDENCDFKLKIHKGFSTNKSSYRLISVSHTKKVCKNLNHLGGEGHNYACNIIQAGKHKNRKGMV